MNSYPANQAPELIRLFSPSGALLDEELLDRAVLAMRKLGFRVEEMPQARLRQERFAGSEAERQQSIKSAFEHHEPAVLMATRGGYGLSRLLHVLDIQEMASLLNSGGHILSGHSDMTGLQLALLANGAKSETLLHGPMACFDFGAEQGADTDTCAHFLNAVRKRTVEVTWQADRCGTLPCLLKGKANAFLEGLAWGGNLTLVCSLLGTQWLPDIHGGILILEDVNEPVYKIERMLLQLLHAGVLQQQQAVILGNFSEPKPGNHDNGYSLKSAAAFLQAQLPSVPVLMGFPFGHCTPKACWFQGMSATLTINASGRSRLQQGPGHRA